MVIKHQNMLNVYDVYMFHETVSLIPKENISLV